MADEFEDAPLTIKSVEAEVTPPREGDDLPLTFRTVEEQQAAQPQRTPAETAEGLRRTGKAALVQNIPAIFGAPGSIETFASDVAGGLTNLGITGAEKMDWLSPQAAEEWRAKKPWWIRESEAMPGVVEKGYVSPILSLPTWKGIKEGMRYAGEQSGRKDWAYKPETPGEKVLESTIEGAVQGVPGKVAGMTGRMVTGAGAGAATETLGQMTEGQENEPFARLVGALGGGYAASKLANAMLPATVGRMNIADAIAEDMRKGQSPMTMEQAQEAVRNGTPLSIMELAGPATLKTLSQYANLSAETQTRSGIFNRWLVDRAAEAGSRVGENIRGVMNAPNLNADTLQQLNQLAGRNTRTNLWRSIESQPAAQAIPIEQFSPKLLQDVDFKAAMERATKNSARLPDDFNIKVPQFIEGQPGTERKIMQTPTGFQEIPGTPAVPAKEMPGNMAYMHQVDIELGGMIRAAKRSGDDALAKGLIQTQNNLRDELDKVMRAGGAPMTYRDVVGASRKTFVAEEAPQAGYEFASSLINSRKNPFKRGDVKREFDSMDDRSKEFVQLGVAARLQDAAESGQLGKIAKKFTEDKAFQQDMQHILGPEKYNQIMGNVLRENVIQQAETLRFIGERMPVAGAGVLGAGAAVGNDIIQAMIYGPGVSGAFGNAGMMNKAMASALAAMGVKYVATAAERRVAENVLPLVFSKDPKDAIKLGELATNYPIVNQFFNRLTTSMAAGLDGIQQSLQRQDQAPKKQRDGGRIERKAGGRTMARNHEADADALVAKAEQAKNQHSKRTEALLNSDDDAIAKALAVANKHIEG